MYNKKLLFCFRLTLSISIILFLLYKINFSRIYAALLQADMSYLALIISVYIAFQLLGILNLKIILSKLLPCLSWRTAARYFLLSFAFGMSLPGKLGEASIIYYLRKEGVPLGSASGVILLDKLISFGAIVIFSSYGAIMFLAQKEITLAIAFIIIAVVIAGLILLSKCGRAMLLKLTPKKVAVYFHGFGDTISYYLLHGKKLILADIVLTFIRYALNLLLVFLALRMFGAQVSFIHVLVIQPVIYIATYLPITLGGLGVREALAVVLYARILIPEAVTLAAFIILAAITYTNVILILMLLYFLPLIGVQKRPVPIE